MLKKEDEVKLLLISLMYHHINSDKYSNDLDIFKKHLEYIISKYNIVVPGDELKGNDICLTFDDAFFDFYYYVFPLLKKYKVKAILAVPSKYILDDTKLDYKKRLNVLHDESYAKKESFCTFKELKEMSDSGFVLIASHTHSHINLNETKELEFELKESKNILENKLNIRIDSFIFPFGKYNDEVLNECKKHYKYLFRIGNGINENFNGINDVIYRINADSLKNEKDIFSFFNMLKYRIKSIIKSF